MGAWVAKAQGRSETALSSYLLLQGEWEERTPGVTKRLQDFADAATRDYALAQVPLKDEDGKGPFNQVFIQCMKFFRSSALADFIGKELGVSNSRRRLAAFQERLTKPGRMAKSDARTGE